MTMTHALQAEVATFVDLVRIYLGDLDDVTRDELTEGLLADMTDLVIDQGIAALPDPEAYAEELRHAAGIAPRPSTSPGSGPGAGLGSRFRARFRARLRAGSPPGVSATWGTGGQPTRRAQPLSERVEDGLDRGRDRFLAWVGSGPRAGAWELVTELRPAWWVARGYLAVQVADIATGPWEPIDLLPAFGVPGVGPALVLGAVVTSVQVGRRRWWPRSVAGRRRARLGVLAANLAALFIALPVTVQEYGNTDRVVHDVADGRFGHSQTAGLNDGGRRICNIHPYGADGLPLHGVQLFDQDGRPVRTRCDAEQNDGIATFGWQRGEQTRFNVFPQPQRRQSWGTGRVEAWDSRRLPAFPAPEMAAVPPVQDPLEVRGLVP